MGPTGKLALDANVIIALATPAHVHHFQAVETCSHGTKLIANPISIAEAMMGYEVHEYEIFTRTLHEMEICPISPPDDEAAIYYASAAKATGAKLPDAIALATAQYFGATLVTFDNRLAKSAARAGYQVQVP